MEVYTAYIYIYITILLSCAELYETSNKTHKENNKHNNLIQETSGAAAAFSYLTFFF